MATLKKFLDNHKVAKGSEFTHTSLDKYGGSYYINGDKQDEFMKLYAQAIVDGAELYLTEKHRDQSPILIDLDFRQDVNERLYTDDMIRKFVKALNGQIFEYVEVPNDKLTFYVMEKGFEARANKSGGFKDGVHIVCPEVVTKPEIQHIIRENIMKESMANIFGSTFKNSYDDIYDKAVIDKNNWFMYGSKKPDEKYAWTVTKVLNADCEEIDIEETEDGEIDIDKRLVQLLSIRNKFDCAPVKADKVDEVKAYKQKHTKHSKAAEGAARVEIAIPSHLETIEQMVMMLNPKRADDYHQWLIMGLCLKSISDDCLGIWVKFSKQSSKFVDGECEKMWQNLAPKNITEGTLRHLARTDNPEAYKELMKDDLQHLLHQSKIGTHTDIARVVHAMFKDTYKCCFIGDKPCWYEFKNHRWIDCPDAVTLKQKLSTDVFKLYTSMASACHAKAAASDNEAEQIRASEDGKKFATITIKLKNVSFKSNIITECRELFAVSQKEFYDKLNERKDLLGFNNGVFDMDVGCFRDGSPEDMLTYSTNTDFQLEDNPEYRYLIDNFMWSMFEDGSVVDFVWDTIGYSAHGDKFLEFLCFWTGNGANGKGSLAKLIKNAFGDYYYEPNVTVFTCKKTNASAANPELAKTKGKRFVLACEPEEGDKFQVGALKNWSGGDRIQARELFKNPIEFDSQFLIGIQMNTMPKLSDFDGGIARRLRIIHFPFKFVEKPTMPNERQGDTSLKNRFENDKAIAQQFMRMVLERYMTRIKGNKSICVPDKVMEFTNEYLEDNNILKKFLTDFVNVTGNQQDVVLSTELYNTFRSSEYYTQGNDKKWFAQKMKQSGYESERYKGRKPEYRDKMVYNGMKTKPFECSIKDDLE